MSGLAPLSIPDGSTLGVLLGSNSLSSGSHTGNLNGRAVVVRERESEGCCLWECLQAIFCFTQEEVVQPKELRKRGEPKKLEVPDPIAEETEGEEAEVEMPRRKASSEDGKEELILVN